jgi:hypothetical protein
MRGTRGSLSALGFQTRLFVHSFEDNQWFTEFRLCTWRLTENLADPLNVWGMCQAEIAPFFETRAKTAGARED